jgi:hypothetical protein
MNFIDETEIKKTISVMKPDNQLFEVRVIYSNNNQNLSGYFTDADTLIGALRHISHKNCNVYITLNQIDTACYSRMQRDEFYKSVKTSTKDGEIEGYDWLMIDLDPTRVPGVSSSADELKAAHELGNKIYVALKNLGFEKPICADSGNGVHLLYKINLDNNAERTELVKRCLQALDMLFSNDVIRIDVSNHNPSRICKLYGTLAQKGSNTKERPHRMSRITMMPDVVKDTDISYLQKLAAMYPDEPEKPQPYNNYSPRSFDLDAWLQKYGIGYKADNRSDGSVKYILDHCPFDENHNGKDAAIFKSASGAIGFHCFHNSCQGKTWRDVRLLKEPNAYEKEYQFQEKRMYGSFNRDKAVKMQPKRIEKQDDEPIFFTAQMILDKDKPQEEFIRTGITTIDKKMRGLKKGHVSVWSGLRASAKSTVLSQICLNAVNTGNNVGVYSGELTETNFMRWMNQQAAGKGNVKPSQNEGYYYTPRHIEGKIANWLGKHFWLYNNFYGNDYQAVMAEFEKKIDECQLDMLILDNLMAFNISSLGYTKWDAQSAFVLGLSRTAKIKNVHIAFVAHPKKANGFLRFDDISGTADLGNAVDDAFIVHRNNNDFKRLSKDMFHWSDDNEVYDGTNVIEIVKDRDGGNQDVFIPLYYEVESKRLKNYQAENIVYGWDDSWDAVAEFAPEIDDNSNPFGLGDNNE